VVGSPSCSSPQPCSCPQSLAGGACNGEHFPLWEKWRPSLFGSRTNPSPKRSSADLLPEAQLVNLTSWRLLLAESSIAGSPPRKVGIGGNRFPGFRLSPVISRISPVFPPCPWSFTQGFSLGGWGVETAFPVGRMSPVFFLWAAMMRPSILRRTSAVGSVA
jgi:hypothetical protein